MSMSNANHYHAVHDVLQSTSRPATKICVFIKWSKYEIALNGIRKEVEAGKLKATEGSGEYVETVSLSGVAGNVNMGEECVSLICSARSSEYAHSPCTLCPGRET